MTEQFTEPQQFTTPILKDGPLHEPDQLEPALIEGIKKAFLELPSWKELDHTQTFAMIDVTNPGWAHLVSGEGWNFQGSQRLSARTHESYPAWVLLSKEFRHDRIPTMRMLDHLKHIMGDVEGTVYIFEEAGEDKEVPKRLDLLKNAGFVDPQIHFDNKSYAVWEGKNKTDQTQESSPRPDLEFQTIYEMAIPLEVKRSKLMAQRPKGDVLYVDQRDPDTAIIVNPDTWQPVLEKGKPQRLTISKIVGRNIAAIVYHTPPRTPEMTFDQDLANAASLLKRTQEKDEGIITAHHQGALFIVEDKGTDTIKKWREQMMNNIGLVMNVGNKESDEKLKIEETDQYIITTGRLAKERSAINLLDGKNGHYYAIRLEQMTNSYRKLGYSMDSAQLLKDLKATKNVPRTLTNLTDGNNVTFIDNECGECVWHRDKNGVTTRKSLCETPDHKEKGPPPPVPEVKPIKLKSEVLQDVQCPDCSSNLRQNTFVGEMDRDEEEVQIEIETFCPKQGCRGEIANEKRFVGVDTFLNNYNNAAEDLEEESEQPHTNTAGETKRNHFESIYKQKPQNFFETTKEALKVAILNPGRMITSAEESCGDCDSHVSIRVPDPNSHIMEVICPIHGEHTKKF